MRILATAAFAFAAAVFSTLVLPEGSWLPMGLAALAGVRRKQRQNAAGTSFGRLSSAAARRWACCTQWAIAKSF